MPPAVFLESELYASGGGLEFNMSWFDTEGKLPYHVIFSQTSYARNAAGMPFIGKCDQKSLVAICDRIDSMLLKNGFRRENIPDEDTLRLGALFEKGFIPPDLLRSTPLRAIYFNEPCSLAVSVGGSDLLTVRSLLPGLSVAETRNIASGAEELLDSEIEFAYNDAAGYLSPTPSGCGSGAEFTALLYLPSLRLCGSTEALRQRLLRSKAELFPFLKNGSAADLYILSHTPSHTCDEQLSAEAFGALLMRIVEEESAAERIIFSSSSKIMTDKAWRAYGALLYARDLTALDMLSLCSSVRIALACHDGKDAKLPPVSTVLLNTILARGLDCSVITETGICRSRDECCSRRAELVSNLLRSFGKAE